MAALAKEWHSSTKRASFEEMAASCEKNVRSRVIMVAPTTNSGSIGEGDHGTNGGVSWIVGGPCVSGDTTEQMAACLNERRQQEKW